jgi:CRISPR/Cas system-associated endonuclease Cas1
VKVLNLQVNTYGNYLGIYKGCIILRDKEKNVQRFPLSEAEVGEIVLNCGNTVSVDALAMLALWGIDVVIAKKISRANESGRCRVCRGRFIMHRG